MLLKALKINLLYNKKADGPALRNAEVQVSTRQFSHGLDCSFVSIVLRVFKFVLVSSDIELSFSFLNHTQNIATQLTSESILKSINLMG